MHHLTRRVPNVCHRCASRLARPYTIAHASRHNGRPFRLAVIGSGPAGFYSAYRVLNRIQDSVVDMYEHLPVPYGLVRFGVAPDHPEVKNCQDKFEEVAQSPRFNFVGNVDVGHDIPLTALAPHYDAILFAYGASKDRRLGIPGEDLPGVYSARAFVGWYNGLPEYADLDPKLDAGEEAVVIGQGNVALDVARILLSDVDALRKTDIAPQALDRLAQSKVRSVRIVGRRGPMQAAFTIKEVRELLGLPGIAFEPIDPALFPPESYKLTRQAKRITKILSEGSPNPASSASKMWALQFLHSPKAFHGSPNAAGSLSHVEFERTAFVPEADPFERGARVTGTGATTALPAALAFRSVGYKSTALAGLDDLGVPFDEGMGIIPNDMHGRVVTPAGGPSSLTAAHVPGMYCAGWVKRGPTGVIASTMEDAFSSADIIARDWQQEAGFLNGSGLGWEGVRSALGGAKRIVSWGDWKRIDEAEKAIGREKGREREKFTRVEDMLRVLDG
ncbi:uncharacterized protein K452DRAFT_302466 [Aplosporella prunicola CBS 121167]|uniref:NADPH:adrenodoxin oxidoreductase, mitochondrial n=1 Tax=Aplosporella prunicola CBS 121167 TaxID=1176127 RepID=A0A6A6B014_9PEZI|nr:uncharacterized protein K452DRAFT_302466 [Aplosporella prunicola CBS 121167]KAF2136773.1 hypothetical protein K452DRAFT_302466 [Aplosporella prunicola CBS 121167]